MMRSELDLFVTMTITLSVLYCVFAISHGRWRMVHLTITTSRITQQFRGTLPFDPASGSLICDRDEKYRLVKSLEER